MVEGGMNANEGWTLNIMAFARAHTVTHTHSHRHTHLRQAPKLCRCMAKYPAVHTPHARARAHTPPPAPLPPIKATLARRTLFKLPRSAAAWLGIRQFTPSTHSTRSCGQMPTMLHSPKSVLIRSLQLYSLSSCGGCGRVLADKRGRAFGTVT